ncbi:hypothetical protein PSTG_10107 [Puccinia striiformis f. sp. tritici PST-78]|uniref:Uncharacterized protein n=1 Tax=Puccinia striiformis f. sp. tritici PST-78 TaxID=1165861 RepID=A0A0L0VBA7_9BASI|nr:hypothetical protein PSTG_10107 [Puccinia striiformis f. sp. tritici PST-78]
MPYSTERMGFMQLSKFIAMVVVVLGLMIAEKDMVAGRTITARSADSEARSNHGQSIERRASLPSGMQPLFYLNATSTIYGGYSSKELRLADNKNPFFGLNINIGSVDFYAKDLPSYLRDRLSPNNYGIYGFAANFNTQAHSSDYSFFKSVSNDRNSLSEKGVVSPSHQSRSLQPAQFINKRQDDQVQCRNRNGESFLFSKNACYMAAAKMTSQKTAMSSCGSCQLVVIGPQGQISSSNMPASAIRAHTENILAGCFMSQRADSSNIVPSTFTNNTIPANAKPNYVLLLVKGSGESCDQ